MCDSQEGPTDQRADPCRVARCLCRVIVTLLETLPERRLDDENLGERLEKALKPVLEHFLDESEGEMQKNLGTGELQN